MRMSVSAGFGNMELTLELDNWTRRDHLKGRREVAKKDKQTLIVGVPVGAGPSTGEQTAFHEAHPLSTRNTDCV